MPPRVLSPPLLHIRLLQHILHRRKDDLGSLDSDHRGGLSNVLGGSLAVLLLMQAGALALGLVVRLEELDTSGG